MQALTILSHEERRLVETEEITGFIPEFEAWASKKTDAPQYTMRAAALMALSLAAGDTVVLPNFFGQNTYMNLYILIVGPSTVLRKSTVLGMVKDIMPKNVATDQEYIVVMDDVSNQAFNKVAAMQGALMAPVLMNVDEVSGLFQTIRKSNSYLAGFDKTLMRAYDHSPIHIKRVNDETVAKKGAFINIFAASTPEPLMDVLNADDVASGLLPRFLIFDATEAQRGARRSLRERLEVQEDWEDEAEELRSHLGAIAVDRASGIPIGTDVDGNSLFKMTTIDFEDDALDRLDEIDEAWSKTAMTDDSDWAAIKGRGFWHLTKLAGLFALGRAGKECKVQMMDVLRAAHLVEATIGDLSKMQQEVGATRTERRILEALEMIRTNGNETMKVSQIANRMRLTSMDVRDIGSTLIVRGLIDAETKPGYWRAL